MPASRLPSCPAFVVWTCLAITASARLPAQEVVLVEQGTPMRYLAPESDPGFALAWVELEFDDSTWSEGSYGIGYGAGGMLATEVPDTTHVVYTRVEFEIDDLGAISSLHLGADHDDGYVAWLNGMEIGRASMPDGAPGFDTDASSHESSNGDTADYGTLTNVTAVALPELVEGRNVLAVGAWNVGGTSSDLALVPYLSANRGGGDAWCGTLAADTRWTLEESPIVVECDLEVPEGVRLTIDPGVEVRVEPGEGIVVRGEILALGEPERPISITSAGGGSWDGIRIDHGGGDPPRECTLRHVSLSRASELLHVEDTGDSPILAEDCAFDSWTALAVKWDDGANGLILRRCRLGVETPLADAAHETINGYRSSVIVEHCTFGRRRNYNDVIDLGSCSWPGPVPTVRYNTFLGGDDDAIDFDNCDGWIVGNVILDHWPAEGASGSANGGGITGNEGSSPVVVGNIVARCYHGIGYKNGCTPLLVNNLVVDCNVGISLYKDSCGADEPEAVLRGNVVWNNRDADSGEDRNIVLDGTWWPSYCQDPEPQGVADVAWCLVEGGYEGPGNLDIDPRLRSPDENDFTPAADSPLLDAGFAGALDHAGVPPDLLAAVLSVDREGRAPVDLTCIEDSGTGEVAFRDLGPIELPAPGPCSPGAPRFVRGDATGDGATDISDAVFMLLALFAGGDPGDCDDARDTDDDGELDISDAVALLQHLFRGGPAPPAPYPATGEDVTADDLTCGRSPG